MAEKIKQIKEDSNYLRVFNNIWKIKELTPHSIMVLSLLVSYDELNKKDITLTSKAIAKHFNFKIAKKTVDAILPKLEELSYITKRMEDVWDDYKKEYENKRLIEITPKTYAIINGELPVKESSKPTEMADLKPTEEHIEPEVKKDSPTIKNDVDGSDDLQAVKEKEELKIGVNEGTSTSPEIETEETTILVEIKNEITNKTVKPAIEKVKDSKQLLRGYEKKCVAEAKAEQNNSSIITFKEFTKDYAIDEEISEALTPVADLSPFMVSGKLKVNFNKREQSISINSDDIEIKLPNIGNSYHPELFIIPNGIGHLIFRKGKLMGKSLIEPPEKNIEPELILESSDSNDNDDDGLPW